MLYNHQGNMSVQYTIVQCTYMYFSEIEIFQLNICDIFLVFVQNIDHVDCGYTEPPPKKRKRG